MPCYETRTVSVNTGALQAHIVGRAFEKMGLKSVTVDLRRNTVKALTEQYGAVSYENGRLTAPQNWAGLSAFNENYSIATVEQKAEEMGWDIASMTTDADGNYVMEAER